MGDARAPTGNPEDRQDPVLCPQCGRRYVRTDDRGQPPTCLCGHVPDAIETDSCLSSEILAPDPTDTGLYELAWDVGVPPDRIEPKTAQACPMCNLAMARGAILCLNCGYNTAQQRKIRTRMQAPAAAPASAPAPRPADTTQWDTLAQAHGTSVRTLSLATDNAPGRFTEWYLPLILIGVGLLFTGLNALTLGGPRIITGYYLFYSIVLQLFVMVPLLLGLLVVLAKLLDVNFGTLPTALLKLAAIAVGPLSIAQFITIWLSQFTFGLGGLLFYVVTHFVCCAVFVGSMFDLDYFETFVTAMAIIILRFLVVTAMLMLFLGS